MCCVCVCVGGCHWAHKMIMEELETLGSVCVCVCVCVFAGEARDREGRLSS